MYALIALSRVISIYNIYPLSDQQSLSRKLPVTAEFAREATGVGRVIQGSCCMTGMRWIILECKLCSSGLCRWRHMLTLGEHGYAFQGCTLPFVKLDTRRCEGQFGDEDKTWSSGSHQDQGYKQNKYGNSKPDHGWMADMWQMYL